MSLETVQFQQDLSTKQLKAIPIILSCKSIAEGCERIKISRESFYSWLRDPVFKAEFIKQRQELIDLALHELKASTSEAVAVLRELLGAEEEGVRLRTAQSILGAVLKSIEIENIEARVTLLEEKIKKNGKS